MKTLFVMVAILFTSIPVPLFSTGGCTLPADTGRAFDKPPAVLDRVDPKYPESMLSAGWEGTVYVKALIGLSGNVEKAEVAKTTVFSSQGNEVEDQDASKSKEFRESSLTAVKQWKFTPAESQGKPVSIWITIPFRFKLSKDGETSRDEKAIKKTVSDILRGIGGSKNLVAEKADLIFGMQHVDLLAALNGKYPKIKLVEGKDAVCAESYISSVGEGDALVIWKSKLPAGKGERFHTIQLRKTENTWKVVHWHVSW